MNEGAWNGGFKQLRGDASNPTFGIGVHYASMSMHIFDPADAGTDWNVSAATHPTVYLHSGTTPATDYLSVYHDGDKGYLTIAGASALKVSTSIAAPNLGDGYGMLEVELTSTGAMAGHTAAASAWVNLNGTVAAGGNILAARSDGIYVDTGGSGDSSNAIVAYGARLQYIGDDNPSKLVVFSCNVSGSTCDGIFSTVNGNCATELGYTADTTTDDSKIGAVPLFVDCNTGTQYWVRIYNGAS